MNNTVRHAKKRTGIGLILAIIGGILAAAFIAWVVVSYFTPSEPQDPPAPEILNGPDNLLPALSVAQEQIGNFAVTTTYDRIDGVVFDYSASDHLPPQNGFSYDTDVLKYFNVKGKISSTAYLDTQLGILYLDYGLESADCVTYLTLDTAQTGTSEAVPLGGIITAGNGIHSVPYPYDHTPEYITVAGLVSVNNAYYYIMQLHRQELDVITGTTSELAQLGIGSGAELSGGDPVTLDGIWIAVAQPTIADDDDHSYFAKAGYYTMSADGSFTYSQTTLGKQGTWYHMGGGEGTYEGTYQYDGITMTLNYTIYHETYFDETLGYELTRPVQINETEQFPMQINQSCAEMCAVIPAHPRLGQILFFEKCKSDSPIEAILIQINSRF